jgi:aryl-alcohol dehydrogenase
LLGGIVRISAAVIDGRDEKFRIEDVDIDQPRAGEVLVRVVATGFCRTDALVCSGGFPFRFPGVLGHEGAGHVAAVGDGVESLAVGDPVVLGWPWCGRCGPCLAGRPRYCADLGPQLVGGGRADGSTALRRLDGTPLHSHYFGQSSYATYAIVPHRAAVRVDTSLPLAAAGVLGCGIATGAGAVLNAARPQPGAAVAVFGAGAVGLAAVMAAARLSPATAVVAVEPHPRRRDLARRYGATETIDPTAVSDVPATVREACRGQVDVVLECTGDAVVVRQAIDATGRLGTCYLVGVAPTGSAFTADHFTTLSGKKICGVLGDDGQSGGFVPALLRLAEAGRFPFQELIEYLPLAELNEAMRAALHGEIVKPVLTMD